MIREERCLRCLAYGLIACAYACARFRHLQFGLQLVGRTYVLKARIVQEKQVCPTQPTLQHTHNRALILTVLVALAGHPRQVHLGGAAVPTAKAQAHRAIDARTGGQVEPEAAGAGGEGHVDLR